MFKVKIFRGSHASMKIFYFEFFLMKYFLSKNFRTTVEWFGKARSSHWGLHVPHYKMNKTPMNSCMLANPNLCPSWVMYAAPELASCRLWSRNKTRQVAGLGFNLRSWVFHIRTYYEYYIATKFKVRFWQFWSSSQSVQTTYSILLSMLLLGSLDACPLKNFENMCSWD